MTTNRSFWGKGIWIAYGLFAAFILAIVAFASFQHFDLVEPDYYEQGLAHQAKLDSERRTAEERKQPAITYTTDPVTVQVCFPIDSLAGAVNGSLIFFRPSAASYDIKTPIALDANGCQTVTDKRLMTGYWRVKIDWKQNSESYYYEEQLFIEKGKH